MAQQWHLPPDVLAAANAVLDECGAKADAYLATLPDDDDIDRMIREHLVDPAAVDRMLAGFDMPTGA